jgi:hypothetical protein
MMKKIEYQGGLLSFNIPSNWIEEYDEINGGAYYEDIPTSGTLRLNVLTIQSKPENESPSIIFRERKNTIDFKEYLSNEGDEICEYLERSIEGEVSITIYTFACIHQSEQTDYLIAIFTWTIESIFENQTKYIEVLNLLRNNFSNAKF